MVKKDEKNKKSEELFAVLKSFNPQPLPTSTIEIDGFSEIKNSQTPTAIPPIVQALIDKDEKKIIQLFEKEPFLINKSINLSESGLQIPNLIKIWCTNIQVMNENRISMTPLQYVVIGKMNKVAEYAFKILSQEVLENKKSLYKQSIFDYTTFSAFDALLIADNIDIWQKVPREKIENYLNGTLSLLTLYKKCIHIEDKVLNMGQTDRCYPQKIWQSLENELDKTEVKIFSNQETDKEYAKLVAYLQEIKMLKVFLNQKKQLAFDLISEITGTHTINTIHNLDFKNKIRKENAVLIILKAYYEIYQDIPYKIDLEGKKLPLLDTLILGLRNSKAEPVWEVKKDFLHYKEIQEQAKQIYTANPSAINLDVFVNIPNNKGLEYLDKIGVDWSKNKNKPTYILHHFLSESLRGYKHHDLDEYDKKSIKSGVTKFINYCCKHKMHLLEEKKNNKSVLDYLKKLDLEELHIKIEKTLLEENLKKQAPNILSEGLCGLKHKNKIL